MKRVGLFDKNRKKKVYLRDGQKYLVKDTGPWNDPKAGIAKVEGRQVKLGKTYFLVSGEEIESVHRIIDGRFHDFLEKQPDYTVIPTSKLSNVVIGEDKRAWFMETWTTEDISPKELLKNVEKRSDAPIGTEWIVLKKKLFNDGQRAGKGFVSINSNRFKNEIFDVTFVYRHWEPRGYSDIQDVEANS